MPRLRNFKSSDIQPIDDIFNSQPEIGVPSLRHVVSNITIEDDDNNVIGYGVIKLFSEGILILDKKKSRKNRALAVKLAVERAIKVARVNALEQLYFLTSNPSFADILRNKFNFRTVKEEVLMLDINPPKDT